MYLLGKGKQQKKANKKPAEQLMKSRVFGWSLKHLTTYMKLTVTGSKQGLVYTLILLRKCHSPPTKRSPHGTAWNNKR